MDKKLVGNYLRKLREDNNWTQTDLKNKLDNGVTLGTISNWENGTTLPELESLELLTKLYGVSMDSILSGEDIDRIDFYEKYPSAKKDDNILALFDHNKKEEYIEKRDIKLKSELDAIKRYKYLIRKEFDLTITPREEKELFFILKNFGEGKTSSWFEINQLIIQIRSKYLDNEERYFVFSKYVKLAISCHFNDLCDETFNDVGVSKKFDLLDDWEKDKFLSVIQRCNPICVNYPKTSSKALNQYKEIRGRDYSEEEITKDTIKFLIGHGAKIIKEFCSYNSSPLVENKTIDALESMILAARMPEVFPVNENGIVHFYWVERNAWNIIFNPENNNFINELLRYGLSKYEIYEGIIKNKEMPKDTRIKIAKRLVGDDSKSDEEILADSYYDLLYLDNIWKQLHKMDDNRVVFNEARIETIYNDFKNGVRTTYSFDMGGVVGGKTIKESLEYIDGVIKKMSYGEYLCLRDSKLTTDLIMNIDNLDLATVRNKYLGGSH